MMQISPITSALAAVSNLPVSPAPQNPNPSSNSTSSTSAGSTAQSDTQTFITILSAELQAQDPTQPLDPTQFVTQLAQFNSLDELINIRQELAALVPNASGTSSSSVGTTPTNPSQLLF